MKELIKTMIRALLHIRDSVCFVWSYPVSVRQFKSLHQTSSPEQRFNIPFTYKGVGEFSSIKPKQILTEITQLYNTVKAAKPKVVLEIGTFKGGTLYLWCQAASDDAVIVSVDYPMGEWTHPFSWRRRLFYRHFAATLQQDMHFIAADSHRQATLHKVKESLGGKPVDFLFIDGDHSYDGVKKDFDMYSPLVAEGGLIAFHDIQVRPQWPQIQVYKFWREIRGQYESTELIAQDGGMANLIGIGIIKKPCLSR